ncbi:hypothetical protein Btru_072416 [Bulinus truncatus]|nr:hypothetical protein Btru_072416 [Bulinus truncatus]
MISGGPPGRDDISAEDRYFSRGSLKTLNKYQFRNTWPQRVHPAKLYDYVIQRGCRLVIRSELFSGRFLCSFLIVFVALPVSEAVGGKISLYSEGASFPYAVYERWGSSYRAYRSSKKDVTWTYKATTSSSGLNVIMNKPERVDFIGYDNPLASLYGKNHSDLLTFPTVAGAIVIAYNLPNCSMTSGQTLNLTEEHVSVNEMCPLPNVSIIVIARRTSSGSTTVFTSALSAFDAHWKAKKGTFSEGTVAGTDTPVKWNPDVVRYFGETNADIASLVRSIFYSVSYLSLGDATDSNVSYAAVGNRYRQFAFPNPASIQAAMSSRDNDTTLTPILVDQDVPGAYPIATYTYFVFYKRYYGDCTAVMEMLRFFQWLTSDPKSRVDAESAHFSALSENMASRVKNEVLATVTCKGENVLDMIGADTEEVTEMPTWLVPVVVTVLVCLLLVASMCAYIIYHRLRMKPPITESNWNIPIEEIVFFYDEKMHLTSVSGRSKFLRHKSVRSFKSVDEIADGAELLLQILQWPGKWKGNKIGLRLLEVLDMRKVTKEMEHTLLWMRDTVINTNLVRFYGLTELDGSRYVIGDFCSKGTILDILQNGKYNLTEDFKMAVAGEIASGMNFLHLRGLVHGLLTSSCCMLDNKWTVKIADWEYCKLFESYKTKMNPLIVFRTSSILAQAKDDALLKSFWTAPEVLRSEFTEWPTQSGDVYSYAIVLHEVFTRDEPYIELANDMSPEQIIHAVIHNRLRPEPSSDIPISIRQIMEMSWTDVPSSRPSFEQIKKLLRRNQRGRKTIMDSMMETMEDYTNQLEEELQANESSLQAVKSEMDALMSDLVPPDFLPTLNRGEVVESRVYPTVGIVMVDVPDPVVSVDSGNHSNALRFLDKFRTALKSVAVKYQAYHPVCQHHTTHVFLVGINQESVTLTDRCVNVACMALDMLQVMTGLLDQTTQHLRISAHVGQVVAGGSSSHPTHQFFFRGDGLQVGLSLLTAARADTVYISRSLYSQIEKTLEFQLTGQDAEWISCNGQDIECFVLTGSKPVFNPAPSTTSADSGIGGESCDKLLTFKQPVEITNIYATNELLQRPMASTGSGESNRKLRFKEREKKLKTVLRHQKDVNYTETDLNNMQVNKAPTMRELRKCHNSTPEKSQNIVALPDNVETLKIEKIQEEKTKRGDKELDREETNLSSRRIQMFHCSPKSDNLEAPTGVVNSSAKNEQSLNQTNISISHESIEMSKVNNSKAGKEVVQMFETTHISNSVQTKLHSEERLEKDKDNMSPAREIPFNDYSDLIETKDKSQITSQSKSDSSSMFSGSLTKTYDSAKKSKRGRRNMKILPL